MEKLTPRLATVARLQGLSPEQRGGFNSVNQIFSPTAPVSPHLTRTKALFLNFNLHQVVHGLVQFR